MYSWLHSVTTEDKWGLLWIYLICKWGNAHYCSVAYISSHFGATADDILCMNSHPGKATQQTELQMDGFPSATFVYRKVYMYLYIYICILYIYISIYIYL